MRIKVIDNEAKDIKTIVLYRFYKYPDKTSEIDYGFSSYRVLHKGTLDKRLSNQEFTKYGYEFNPLLKNDTLLVNHSGELTQSIIGLDTSSADLINEYILPTLSSSTIISNREFFGSIIVSDYKIMSINLEGADDAGDGCWKVEMYDSRIEGNYKDKFIDSDYLEKCGIDHILPSIIITFGPDSDTKNNSSRMYIKRPKKLSKILELEEYIKELKEIEYPKTLIFTLSTKSGECKVDLSTSAWLSSSEPCRYMNKYTLRNDCLESNKNYLSLSEKTDGDYIVDGVSGNMYGRSQGNVSKFPILNRLTKRGSSTDYLSDKKYFPGNIVTVLGKRWICIKDSKGNYPSELSTYWVPLEEYDSLFSNLVSITTNPIGSGIINPSTSIPIFSNNSKKVIEVISNFGYVINESNTCSISPTTSLNKSDYSLTTTIDSSGNTKTEITVYNWENILKTKSLIVNFNKVNSKVKLLLKIKDSDISYEDWVQSIPNIILNKVLINGIEQEINSEGLYEVPPMSVIDVQLTENKGKYEIIEDGVMDGGVFTKSILVDQNIINLRTEIDIRTINITIETEDDTNDLQVSNNYITTYYGENSSFKVYGNLNYLLVNNNRVNLNESIKIGDTTVSITNIGDRLFDIDIINSTEDLYISLC